jgi:hypothetical protein
MSIVSVLTPQAGLVPKVRKGSSRPLNKKVCVYGEPGAGKTWLACTAPKPIFLLTEHSVAEATFKAYYRATGKDVDVWDINTGADLEAACEYLRSQKHGWETAVLDSFTHIFRRVAVSVFGGDPEDESDKKVDTRRLWGQVANRLTPILLEVCGLPMNVVILCQEYFMDEMRKFVPYVQPRSVTLTLPGYFNLCGRLVVAMEGGEPVRKLHLDPTNGLYMAKNAGGILPSVIVNPDMTQIFNALAALDAVGANGEQDQNQSS